MTDPQKISDAAEETADRLLAEIPEALAVVVIVAFPNGQPQGFTTATGALGRGLSHSDTWRAVGEVARRTLAEPRPVPVDVVKH